MGHKVSSRGSSYGAPQVGPGQRARPVPPKSARAVQTQRHGAGIHFARNGAQHLCVRPFTATPRPIEKFIDEGTMPGVDSLTFVLRECQQHYWNARWHDANGAAPWINERDFTLIGKLVDSMLSPQNAQDFNALSPAMQDAVRNLHKLRNKQGQPRYMAWTTLCALLKAPPAVAPRRAQPPVHPPAPPMQRQPAPRNVQRRRSSAVPLQRPAGGRSRELQEFRTLLKRLVNEPVMMDEDTDALEKLCSSELRKTEVWGKDLSYAMWLVRNAVQNGSPHKRTLMNGLLDKLNELP